MATVPIKWLKTNGNVFITRKQIDLNAIFMKKEITTMVDLEFLKKWFAKFLYKFMPQCGVLIFSLFFIA